MKMMMNRSVGLVSLALFGLASGASAQSYRFTIDSTASYFKGSLYGNLAMSGKMIGNYDATSNPTGTRTKPGLTGAWGATENDPIPLSGVGTCSSAATTPISGGFTLAVDLTSRRVQITGYNASLFSEAPASAVAALTPSSVAFRTQSPTYAYPALTKTISLGPITLADLAIVQTATPGKGVLKLVSTNTYAFELAYPATVSCKIGSSKQTKTVSYVVPMSLSGTLVISGTTAKVTSRLFDGGHELTLPQPVNLPLLSFTLPAGSATANLNALLTITTASLKANHGVALVATASN